MIDFEFHVFFCCQILYKDAVKTWAIILPNSIARFFRGSLKGGPSFVNIEGAIPAPYIKLINGFLAEMVRSPQRRVEFSALDLKGDPKESPLLDALQGLDYEKVRNRLRVMSNLDPIVNLEADEGKITCVFASEGQRKIQFRTLFAPKGESIALEIIPEEQ